MTREEVVTLVTGLVAAYPKADAGKDTIKVYCEDLLDLDREHLAAAVVELRRSSKWLPAISEIRAAVARRQLPHVQSVDEAWAEAVGLMSKIGSYRALGTAGSPYVNRTLRLLGRWADICQEDMTWLRKRFAEAYMNVVGQAEYAVSIRGELPYWLDETLSTLPALAGTVTSLEDRRGR